MKKLIFTAAILAVFFSSCTKVKQEVTPIVEEQIDSTTVKIDSISKVESPTVETQL